MELIREDFAKLFGASLNEIPYYQDKEFGYRFLTPEERDNTILGIMRQLDVGGFPISGEARESDWEDGWRENLNDFISSGHKLSTLMPKYIRPNQILRLNQNYIMPLNENFEYAFFTILRKWIFGKYLTGFDNIYEFGCGSGYNFPLLSNMYPKARLYGMDWSPSAVKIANLLHEEMRINVSGHLFNMFLPDWDLPVGENSIVLTIGALEQLGSKHGAFMEFLRRKKFAQCVHVEPIFELYDPNNLADYLAMRYHNMRNYLIRFLPQIQSMEKRGEIEILKIQRIYFGSLYHDGWSIVVYRIK